MARSLDIALASAFLVFGACTPVPTSAYHRPVLEDLARGRLECPRDQLEVSDITPPDFRYGWDPDAKRYMVRGCGRQGAFLCYHRSELDDSGPLCRSLDDDRDGEEVHLGPWQVR